MHFLTFPWSLLKICISMRASLAVVTDTFRNLWLNQMPTDFLFNLNSNQWQQGAVFSTVRAWRWEAAVFKLGFQTPLHWMHQHRHLGEKWEERGEFLGRFPWSWPGSHIYHFLPHSIGQHSATQLCLESREGCETESQPGQLLLGNNSTAREGNMNL